MNTELSKDCMTETYFDVQKLIYHTILKFQARYNYKDNFDELLSTANLYYVKAYHAHDKKKEASFSTFVRCYVWGGLLIHLDNEIKSQRPLLQKHNNPEVHEQPLIDILDELNQDAHHMVQLVLDTPEDLMTLIADEGGRMKRVLSIIKKYLTNNGWNKYRIDNTIQSIRQTLHQNQYEH